MLRENKVPHILNYTLLYLILWNMYIPITESEIDFSTGMRKVYSEHAHLRISSRFRVLKQLHWLFQGFQLSLDSAECIHKFSHRCSSRRSLAMLPHTTTNILILSEQFGV